MGKLKLTIDSNYKGNLTYKDAGKRFFLPEQVVDVRNWTYTVISSNTRKLTGLVQQQ